jgi:hypothetical protein
MLVIGADPYFFGDRDQIAALAIRHRMPAISSYANSLRLAA